MYSTRQRAVAILYGVACHAAFAVGIAAMLAGLYLGLAPGRGTLHGPVAWVADGLLVASFAVLHSFLLSERGRPVLVRLAPLRLGGDLACTTFAGIASLQLLLVFAAWSPLGPVWWEPHGWLRAVWSAVYGASWLFLLRAMADAGLALQTGFLGWAAVARGRAPRYESFPTHGCFRFVRQPVYLAFALLLWTGPVWTPDHLLVALGWTAYCAFGPRLKERRYLRLYGAAFQRYRESVPYGLPALRPRAAAPGSPTCSSTPASSWR